MHGHTRLAARLLCAAAGALMFLPTACSMPPKVPATAALASPVPPGAARIWFYRDYEPSLGFNDANVSLNAKFAATVSADGSAQFRNVAPGHYDITVDTVGMDVNQSKSIDLPAGQEAYVKVLSLRSWDSGGDMTQISRDTFYVSLVPPQVARTELATHSLVGG